MTVRGRRVTVTDTATQLSTADSDTRIDRYIVVANPSDSGITVDLGGADVTSGAGVELDPAGETPQLRLKADEDLYAIAPAAQSVALQVLETGA